MSKSCYHCNEPILTKENYQLNILGVMQTLCCPGCQSVAEAIVNSGLTSYYRFRTEPAKKNQLVPKELQQLALYDNLEIQQDIVYQQGENKKVTLSLDGLSCAACAWLIEKRLHNIQGVKQISVNSTTQRAVLTWCEEQVKLSDVLKALYKLGFKAIPFEAHQQEEGFKKTTRAYLYRLGVAGLATMQVMMLAVALYMDFFQGIEAQYQQLFRYVSLVFAAPVLLYSASPFYLNAYRSIKALSLSMDVPVSLALLFAYIASCYATITNSGEVYFESVSMFTFFLLLGRFLELRAKHRALASSANLLAQFPTLATLTTGETIAAKSLKKGMRVRVLAGETIPADGVIVQGETSVNEAMLTGESLPISKQPKSPVFAGTINIECNIELEVEKQYQASLLANIVRMQNDALSTKPKLMLVADKVARVFIATILLIAFLTFSYWHIQQADNAFWIMLSVLVATCPCALSLATPTALTCATSTFSTMGLIVRKSHVFETLTKVDHCFIDKTGTLTEGKISLSALHCFEGISELQAKNIAANLEAYSSHPIAKAFSISEPLQVEKPINILGQGISGIISHKNWRIGKKDFALYADKNCQYQFDLYLSCQGKMRAGFNLQDPIRNSSTAFIDKLKQQGIKITMLTGDQSRAVQYVAKQLGIENFIYGACPKEKINFLRRFNYQHPSSVSMMIGDGVNDAPVLSSAHLSVVMGGGTDIAKSSADLILLNDKLSTLNFAFQLAHFTKKIVKQNLAWSLGYNALILPLAVMGVVSPYLAVIGMSTSSVIVVVNSLRIHRFRY